MLVNREKIKAVMERPNKTKPDSWLDPNIINGIYRGTIIIVLYIPALLLPKVKALMADPIKTMPGDPSDTFNIMFKIS